MSPIYPKTCKTNIFVIRKGFLKPIESVLRLSYNKDLIKIRNLSYSRVSNYLILGHHHQSVVNDFALANLYKKKNVFFSKFEYGELFPINFDTTKKNQLSLFLSPSEITNLFCDLMNVKNQFYDFY